MSGEPSFDRVLDEVPYVLRVLRRLGVRYGDREDRAQDVLLAAYKSFATFDATRPLRPWLHGVAFHVVTNEGARAQSRREVLMGGDATDMTDGGPDPERAVTESLERELLIRLMQGLDLDHRAVVSMHIDEIPMDDIARELKIALPTAYKRLDTARRKLQAAAARAERAPRAAGALPLAFTLDALFAAERSAPDDVPADLLTRLRSRLQNAVHGVPVGSAPPSPPLPPGEAVPTVARLAARVMRSTFVRGALAGTVAGGLGGAVGMHYYLTHPMRPSAAPIVQTAPSPAPAGVVASSGVATPGATAGAPASPPASTTATAKAMASGRDENEETLIQTARMAYAHGNTANALDALNRHARRYPRGELAADREALRAQVLERQRLAGAASAAPGAAVAPSATSPPAPRPRFGIDE